MKSNLSIEQLESVKQSFFNILSIFLGKNTVESKYAVCLLKWSAQLEIDSEDFRKMEENYRLVSFNMPISQNEKVEALFNLVLMIYLDNVVEDIELEVASIYAEQLGFEKYTIAELFQSIATAPFDNKNITDVKNEFLSFISNK